MAVSIGSGPAFHGPHRRFGRRFADQRRQDAGGRDCRADDFVFRTAGVDRHAIACFVRPDRAILQKDLRAPRF